MNALADMGPGTRLVRAELGFRAAAGRTFLARRHTPHPFHITRPFHHAGDTGGMATLYLQSSSGGIYAGDDLSLDIRVEQGARAHVTTQASTIVHDARGCSGAAQSASLWVGAGARLDYLPDPAILMAGARLVNRVAVVLEEGAQAIIGDAQFCHDPEGVGRPFARLENEIVIAGAEGPRLIDRQMLDGADWAARTGGFACSGMIVAAGCAGAGAAMAAAAEPLAGVYAGLSTFPDRDIAILRFLATDGVALSSVVGAAWAAASTLLDGRPPAARRK